MGEVLAVLSGKGGTGKTSVCAGLASALAEAGKKILCVDCDVGLRNLDISLGLTEGAALSFLDVASGNYPLSDAARHPVYPSLSFLTAPMNCPVEKIETEPFRAMLRQARREFDFILLDAPAGVDAGFRLVSAAAGRFLLVTGFGPASVRDAARVGDLLELAGKNQVSLNVNRVDKGYLTQCSQTVDDVMDTAGLPLTGVVLEDSNVTLAAAFEKPLLMYAPRCPAAKAFRKIARRLQGYPEPISLR